MNFTGSVTSTALYHSSSKPSKKFQRQADEMLDSELDQNTINNKGFMRLNSLEDEPETMQAAKSCPITETPKRQIASQHKSASFYHHRARHRTHHNNHWQRQFMYQQQQQWWNQQFYYSPQ